MPRFRPLRERGTGLRAKRALRRLAHPAAPKGVRKNGRISTGYGATTSSQSEKGRLPSGTRPTIILALIAFGVDIGYS